MIQVCVSGARGRMGRRLVELIGESSDLKLTAGLEQPHHPEIGLAIAQGVELTDSVERALGACEVLLEFSPPDAVLQHLGVAIEHGKALVSGTTGFDRGQLERLAAGGLSVAVVWGSNMSRGVNAFSGIARAAAKLLSGYDVEILDIHHRNKSDAPSGTAWMLAEAINPSGDRQGCVVDRKIKRTPGEIGLSALRGGDVVGEHQIHFLIEGEQIVLTHRATSREAFCRGALDAVRFAARQPPGFYPIERVFTDLHSHKE